ncbi:RHS repeat-associated core domain-containing protein [Metapseudomonas otitidis]|uniref:RHS repeat-associated core domain-containing protein n=1 Tax=Metapseudomonas otitidis TaxID=319939 RepID=UPI003672B480
MLKEVQQSTARTPYTYLYGPDGQVMGQVRYTTAGRKSQASYYVWLDDLPIAQIDLAYNFAGTVVDSTTLTYLHSDHLNTPRLATNQGGNLVWSWPSDAFGVGQPNNHGSTIDVILRFPGQVADAHSGLYYNYFRDYDPETGRYVESDPIGLAGGLNTYGYVEGNPTRFVDPKGQVAVGVGVAIGIGAAVVVGAAIVSGNPEVQKAVSDIAQGMDNITIGPWPGSTTAEDPVSAGNRVADDIIDDCPAGENCEVIIKKCRQGCIERANAGENRDLVNWLGKCILACTETLGCGNYIPSGQK